MVTHKIIDTRHGGDEVRSKLNEGKTFTAKLPAVK
jgi:hypothetical protein